MSTNTQGSIESKTEFDDSPEGKYQYWATELKTSLKAREPWWKQADGIVKRYLGKKTTDANANLENGGGGFDLNLFHSNTKTLFDMLYGHIPQIDVSRRYAQQNDDIGRVAAEMMERLLNIDVTDNGTDMDAVFRATLQDRLLSGLGSAKVRYTMESEQVPVMDDMGQPVLDPETQQPAMEDKLISEDAPIDYYYWGDLAWGWCRNWAGMPWIGFRSYVTKDEAEKRWGADAANGMKFKKQTAQTGEEGTEEEGTESAWMKAEVWEIWCKETRMIHYISLGWDKQLEEKEDILKLQAFWPVPPFFIANPTTTLYTPTPDFILAQDLYNEIDKLQTRIANITEAVRVVGVYNASADNIKSMFNANKDNDLIPVENWALFGENGGIAGQIEWLPLQDIVAALVQLVTLRDSTIGLLQQVSGMSDVMRGGLENQYEGVGQTEQKAKFGSVRIQALQEQFAAFASNLMQIKAEVIARHFDPETIYKRANMEYSVDQEYVQSAIELIKQPEDARLRVQIRPESVAMVDHAALKNERTDYMNAVSTYMQSASSIIESDPSAKPFVLQLLQWGLAGFKGSSEIEGVIDKAIEASQQAEKDKEGQEEPTPEQAAAQAAGQLEQQKSDNKIAEINAKAQATSQARAEDMQADIQTQHEAHVRKMAEIEGGLHAKIAEIKTSLQADLLMEKAQAQSNILQTNATVEGEIQKDVVEHEINMIEEEGKTQAKLQEIMTNAGADIKKQQVAASLAPEPKPNAKD